MSEQLHLAYRVEPKFTGTTPHQSPCAYAARRPPAPQQNQTSQNEFEEVELGSCVNELDGRPNGFAVGDFNGDGSTDIILSSQGGVNQSQLESFLRILIGDATNYAIPAN